MCSKTRNWVRILMTAMAYYRSVFACGSKLFCDSQQLHKRALEWMVTPMVVSCPTRLIISLSLLSTERRDTAMYYSHGGWKLFVWWGYTLTVHYVKPFKFPLLVNARVLKAPITEIPPLSQRFPGNFPMQDKQDRPSMTMTFQENTQGYLVFHWYIVTMHLMMWYWHW